MNQRHWEEYIDRVQNGHSNPFGHFSDATGACFSTDQFGYCECNEVTKEDCGYNEWGGAGTTCSDFGFDFCPNPWEEECGTDVVPLPCWQSCSLMPTRIRQDAIRQCHHGVPRPFIKNYCNCIINAHVIYCVGMAACDQAFDNRWGTYTADNNYHRCIENIHKKIPSPVCDGFEVIPGDHQGEVVVKRSEDDNSSDTSDRQVTRRNMNRCSANHKCLQRHKDSLCWAEIPKGCNGQCGSETAGDEFEFKCVRRISESGQCIKSDGTPCLKLGPVATSPCSDPVCGNSHEDNTRNRCSSYVIYNDCPDTNPELEGFSGVTDCCHRPGR